MRFKISFSSVKRANCSISISLRSMGYKVLGSGKLSKKLTVQASAFSASAKEAIEAAGGKAEVM